MSWGAGGLAAQRCSRRRDHRSPDHPFLGAQGGADDAQRLLAMRALAVREIEANAGRRQRLEEVQAKVAALRVSPSPLRPPPCRPPPCLRSSSPAVRWLPTGSHAAAPSQHTTSPLPALPQEKHAAVGREREAARAEVDALAASAAQGRGAAMLAREAEPEAVLQKASDPRGALGTVEVALGSAATPSAAPGWPPGSQGRQGPRLVWRRCSLASTHIRTPPLALGPRTGTPGARGTLHPGAPCTDPQPSSPTPIRPPPPPPPPGLTEIPRNLLITCIIRLCELNKSSKLRIKI